jgi:hypothetical protein
MKPKIILNHEVYQKVMHWVNKSQFEVSGLGLIKIENDGVLRVVDAMILQQENTQTHTDISANAVNKAMFELRDSDGLLKWWWHSHVKMPVFWSGTDTTTMHEFGVQEYIIATVFNQKNEMRSAYYDGQGCITPWGAQPLFVDDLETKVDQAIDKSLIELWDKQYADNVKNLTHPIIRTYGTGGEFDYSGTSYIDRGTAQPPTPILSKIYTSEQIKAAKTARCAKERPEGMTKRDWVKLKTAAVVADEREEVPDDLADDEETVKYDDYGFDQHERAYLAQQGWDQSDLDFLIVADFSPNELLDLADSDMSPGDIKQLIDEGHSAADIMALKDRLEALDLSDELAQMTRRRGIIQ